MGVHLGEVFDDLCAAVVAAVPAWPARRGGEFGWYVVMPSARPGRPPLFAAVSCGTDSVTVHLMTSVAHPEVMAQALTRTLRRRRQGGSRLVFSDVDARALHDLTSLVGALASASAVD